MKGMNARCLLVIALVLGIMAFSCPILGQATPQALWSTYHFDMYRAGQNSNSKDIKDPSTIKAIWAFPRADASRVDEETLLVDDSSSAFSASGRWRLQDNVGDAVMQSCHVTDVVVTNPTTPDPNIAKAFWPFPSIPDGKYQVFIWVPSNSAATNQAVYSVTDDFGSRTFTFNQNANSGTWAPLTNNFFTFTGKRPNEGVLLTASQPSVVMGQNKVIADAVKFVPVPNREIYSSPVSADIPCVLTDPDDPSVTIFDDLGTCVYVGAVESGSLASSGAGNDNGAIYCIYGVTPTITSPREVGTVDKANPLVADSVRLMKISEYLGVPKWRYPRNGPDVNSREKIEGPIQGGVYSSPTLATIAGLSGGPNKLVAFVTGMDRQIYALDAVTGELLWKGPGMTVGEEDDGNVVKDWTLTDSREDAFGGGFHYVRCVDDVANATSCTWHFLSDDQINAAPYGTDGLSYSIFVWIPEAGGTGTLMRSRNATYEITYYDPSAASDLGKATITVDQSNPESFGTWVKIGSSYFNPTSVVLKNTATPNPDPDASSPPGSSAADFAVIADAVMFVPDTVEGMGYSTPITDADTILNPTTALATSVFTVTETGRVLSFNVQSPGKQIGHLNWVYPAVRTKKQPTPDEMDKPDLGEMGASPAYANDKLFIAGMNGIITCIKSVKSTSPSEDWTFTSDSDVDGQPGGFTSSPALDGNRLYAASSGGHVYCLDMTGAKKDANGKIVPVWEYPSAANDPPDNPLGAFRYSTPAVAVSQGVKRLWCASSDGRIYSFKADDGTRLFVDDDGTAHGSPPTYDEPSFGLPIQGSIALDGQGTGGQNIIMYVGDMGDKTGTLHWRDAHTGLVVNTVAGTEPYEGWTAPGVMFSSPNLTHMNVESTDVTTIYVGCGDGHLIAFSRKGGAWGGEWQGGQYPFAGDMDTQDQQRTRSAPVTDVQLDVFKKQFFEDSLNYGALDPDPATFDPASWPTNIIVSKEMKVPTETDPTKIDQYLIDQAKLRRNTTNLADSRLTGAVSGVASDTVYYEWGEKIYCIVWNLPAQEFLHGSSIRDKIKPRMTNQSVGTSAGATSGGQTGNVNGLDMKVLGIKDYTCLRSVSGPGGTTYDTLPDSEGNPVRRSYALISIDIDGSRDRPPGPGPGWTLYIDMDKIPGRTATSHLPPIRQTVPLAKLTPAKSGGGYDVLLINNQIREAPLGINNPIGIRDDGILNGANNGNQQIAWNYPNPVRTDPQAHLNGNVEWVANTGSNSSSQPYNYRRLPTPMIYLDQVVHGTSSREAPLGIMDRSAMGLTYRQIPRFRIEPRDLAFRGGESAIECDSGIPGMKYGLKFPWDMGLGSIDYPNIYSRYQSYQLISTDIDPTKKASTMLPVVPAVANPVLNTALVRPDTVLVSVDVPRFQPANQTPDYADAPGGYSRTMISFVDSNNNGSLDSGNVNRGRPTTWQEVYRTFRVELKVPPDPKLLVDEQLIDIGRAPHGLGQNMTGAFAFTAFNKNPLIQQWFKPITIRNAGNVNLYNIRLDQQLALLGDQASPSQQLPGIAITSSLDVPARMDAFGVFTAPPFMTTTVKNAAGGDVFAGYTLSKPRVGDVDPTVMTIPDRRKWDNDFTSRQAAQSTITDAGWATNPDDAQPLPVLVSVQVPLTQPVGTYQSWDPQYRMPYVSVFSDILNKTASGPAGPIYGQEPMAVPSFQLKIGVRENQLTGGATPTTLPQIDFIDDNGSGIAPPERIPKYGDSTPAAYRDASDTVRLFYSSNRLDPSATPPTSAGDLANFASAPWFIHEAQLGYRQSNWIPADPMHWWKSNQKLPESQWNIPSGDPAPPDLMKFDAAQYSVRHFSPSIGENLSIPAAADANRTWLAWAGTADFRDQTTNKIRQESLIFYTDITHDSNASSTDPPQVFAIEHDQTQLKRYPSVVPDKNNMWMFWQGGTQGNWSIYYSTNNGGPTFSATTQWRPDQKLRTPDCLASVGSPNPILRRFGADLRGASGPGSDDFTDPFRTEYDGAYKAFDVVYAGTNKITRNSDIMLSRYVAYGPSSTAPNRTGQPMARVYNEKLARDPKLGFYTSQHIAWVRLRSGGNPGIDDWGNYNGTDLPYVQVVFRNAYSDGTVSLPANSVISATDGSVRENGVLTVAGTPIIPEMDAASGVYTYSYPKDSAADKVLGKMIVDYSSGIIRFSRPLKETATIVNGVSKFSAPEVFADYTPQALRITTDSAVDGSPRAFIERTSMTDKNRGGVTPGLDPQWGSGKPAPVDRLWVFWRKTGASIENSTIFYTTMRVGVDLTKLGLPPIAMDPLTGTFATGPNNPNVQIPNALGPWEVDRTGTKIYFSEVDERYRSANFAGPGPLQLSYDYVDSGGNQQSVSRNLTDVTWMTELPEQSLGFTMDANVNEGSIYAFADPQPQLSGTSVGIRSSKIWVFWTSTRGGNSDLFWETLSPNFWGR